MIMLRFFRRKKEKKQILNHSSVEKELLDKFESSLNLSYSDRNVKLKENNIWKEIQTLEKQSRENISLLALYRILDKEDTKHTLEVVRRKIFKAEFNVKTPPSKDSLLRLFEITNQTNISYSYALPPNDILFCFRYYKENYGKDSQYIKAKNHLVKLYNKSYGGTTLKKIVLGLEKLDYDEKDYSIYYRKDILGKHLSSNWDRYDDLFKKVIKHCWTLGQKPKPTNKWLKTSQELIDSTTKKEAHIKFMAEIFEILVKFGREEVKRMNDSSVFSNKNNYYLSEINEIALSYLIWYAALYDNDILNSLIGKLALVSYDKIKWIGSLSTKNGNACMYAFTIMSPKTGVTQLLNIRNKTRSKSIKNVANKQLMRKAQELEISKEALLELSVSEYNLDGNLSKWDIGEYTAVIDLSDLKNLNTYWINNTKNKKQKSIPQEVSQNYEYDLKQFKSTLREIKTAISVHAKRLENTYLDNIEWSIDDWKSKYIAHPFLSRYTSKLIWFFDEKDTGILKEGEIIRPDNTKLDLSKYTKVKLWHPIYSDLRVTMSWRNYIIENEIKQSFKQAFREVYIVTDAEITTNNYSNRFAAHILYQHQFAALAKIRDWNYTLQGAFDSHNTPSKLIPNFQLRAEFWVESINEEETTTMGIYSYVASDQVRIYSGKEVLEMVNVPKIVFSEIMRDVDLFVGVSSIGNNPEWEDAGNGRAYWQSYSFGDLTETAKTRRDVLQRILPKLKISDRCHLDKKFLTVNGKIRNYKIHLGSGNIMMSPNDQYLCIVPNSRNKTNKIFLPFDNDRTLSIIISKAFLLYNDDKITDKSITRQINL